MAVFLLAVAITAGGAPGFDARADDIEASVAAITSESDLVSELIRRADRDRLHETSEWLALLHYEWQWLPPATRSRVITEGFFLSPTGASDPLSELHATLRAFFDPGAVAKEDEHPQCAFIARRHWLSERLGIAAAELPPVSCPRYDEWRGALDARGLTLIFPEGFVSNPASMFGHTLLRVDGGLDEESDEILGYAVDFTALAGDDRALVYVFKGIFGFYPSFFGVRPYYQQLKRYSDWENRDIWEYRLDVSRDELDYLLMHLWELRDVEFPYYFFTKNCSYELLRLLEIGVIDFDASDRFHGPVVPIETVRVIAEQPGFVSDTRYRPSPETRLRYELGALASEDRDRVGAIVEGRLDPADEAMNAIPLERRARILDVAYDQLRYEFLASQVSDEASRGLSRRILIARSRIDVPESPVPAKPVADKGPTVSPDHGHDTLLLALRPGWRDDEAFIDIRLRPAAHGLMDDGRGYAENMQIRVLDTVMRIYPETGKVRLQELTLLDILSLNPRSRIFEPWAWSLGTGLQTRRIPSPFGLRDVPVWGTEMGIGLAWDPTPSVLLYGLADLRLDVGPDLEDKVSFGPGARLGVLFGAAEARWKGHLFGEVTWFGAGDSTTSARGGVEGRFSLSRNTALILDTTANHSYGETWAEVSLQLNLHF